MSAPPATVMPLTQGTWKTRACVPANRSVQSTNSMPKRVSGLSLP